MTEIYNILFTQYNATIQCAKEILSTFKNRGYLFLLRLFLNLLLLLKVILEVILNETMLDALWHDSELLTKLHVFEVNITSIKFTVTRNDMHWVQSHQGHACVHIRFVDKTSDVPPHMEVRGPEVR